MNTQEQKSNYTEKRSETQKIVAHLVLVLSVDYSNQFKSAYPTPSDIGSLKARLMMDIENYHAEDVIAGYEASLEEHPEFMPVLPLIISHIRKFDKARKRRVVEDTRILRIESNGPKKITPRKKAPSQLLREAIADHVELSEKDHNAKMKELIAEHRLLLSQAPKTEEEHEKHPCSISWCKKIGDLSKSVSGSERFYCSEHIDN